MKHYLFEIIKEIVKGIEPWIKKWILGRIKLFLLNTIVKCNIMLSREDS